MQIYKSRFWKGYRYFQRTESILGTLQTTLILLPNLNVPFHKASGDFLWWPILIIGDLLDDRIVSGRRCTQYTGVCGENKGQGIRSIVSLRSRVAYCVYAASQRDPKSFPAVSLVESVRDC